MNKQNEDFSKLSVIDIKQAYENLSPMSNYEMFECNIRQARLGEDVVNKDMRSLVLSDIHFTQNKSLADSLPATMRKISNIILTKNITAIFIIGDIVEQSRPIGKEALYCVIEAFDQLGIPVILMPGNHDRGLFSAFNFDDRLTNVKLYRTHVLILEHPDPQKSRIKRIILSHDFGNNFKLDTAQKKVFLPKLKEFYKEFFLPDDFLLIGHLHCAFSYPNIKCQSVDQFSYDFNKSNYAIITGNPEFNIEYVHEKKF